MQTSTTDDRWLVDHSGQIVDIRNFYAALATLLSFQPRMNPKSIQTIDTVMTVVYDGSLTKMGCPVITWLDHHFGDDTHPWGWDLVQIDNTVIKLVRTDNA